MSIGVQILSFRGNSPNVMVHLSETNFKVSQTLFADKKWQGAEICWQLPSKNWSHYAVNRAVRKYKNLPWLYNSRVCPATVATNENQETVETLWKLLKHWPSLPGTHDAIRKIS